MPAGLGSSSLLGQVSAQTHRRPGSHWDWTVVKLKTWRPWGDVHVAGVRNDSQRQQCSCVSRGGGTGGLSQRRCLCGAAAGSHCRLCWNSAVCRYLRRLSQRPGPLLGFAAVLLPRGKLPHLSGLLSRLSPRRPSVAGRVRGPIHRPRVLSIAAAPLASRCEFNAPCDPSPLPLLNSCFKNSVMRDLLAQLEVFIKPYYCWSRACLQEAIAG